MSFILSDLAQGRKILEHNIKVSNTLFLLMRKFIGNYFYFIDMSIVHSGAAVPNLHQKCQTN